MNNLFEQLDEAKRNVRWLLDHADGSVDCHGIEYWTSVVVRTRKRIKEAL